MKQYVADFETTTDENDARVWACCAVNIDSQEVELLGNSIEEFMEFIQTKNSTVYFHNLKFDAEFVISFLLNHGWQCNDSREPNTFSTLITDTGVFYSITLYFKKYKKRYRKCELRDSYKKLPFTVKKIAEAFKLDIMKGEIDYNAPRAIGHELTDIEKAYIINDCMIVAQALKIQFEQDLTKMTIGSDALSGFKKIIEMHNFNSWFPILPLDVDNDIRRAYRGGFVWTNPLYRNKRVHGRVYDANSLYPWAMYECPMPFGVPVFTQGSIFKIIIIRSIFKRLDAVLN